MTRSNLKSVNTRSLYYPQYLIRSNLKSVNTRSLYFPQYLTRSNLKSVNTKSLHYPEYLTRSNLKPVKEKFYQVFFLNHSHLLKVSPHLKVRYFAQKHHYKDAWNNLPFDVRFIIFSFKRLSKNHRPPPVMNKRQVISPF